MSWFLLFIAGLFEIGWAVGLKLSENFTKPWPTAFTVVSLIVSLGPIEPSPMVVLAALACIGASASYGCSTPLMKRALGEHIFPRYVELKRREWDQYRVQVTSVKNGIVKGVEQWRLCSEHADACKKNDKGGDGWIGKGPVVLTKSPVGGGFTGFSQVGELVATFQEDGSMKVAYRLDLDRLADKAGRQAPRRFPICSSDPTCSAQLY